MRVVAAPLHDGRPSLFNDPLPCVAAIPQPTYLAVQLDTLPEYLLRLPPDLTVFPCSSRRSEPDTSFNRTTASREANSIEGLAWFRSSPTLAAVEGAANRVCQ